MGVGEWGWVERMHGSGDAWVGGANACEVDAWE